MHIDPTDLGIAIRLIREKSGKTQHELAEDLGVTINYLSLVENGKRGMSIPNINKLADIFSIPASFIIFLGTKKSKGKANSDSVQLVEKIQAMIVATIDTK